MAERALATAFVNVVPGTKDFESMLKGQLAGQMPGIGDAAGTNFNRGFGGALGKLGGILGVALSVGAVTNFTRSLIDAANAEVVGNARLENITKQMGLFGDQAGAVSTRLEDLATKQQLSNGIDDDMIKLTMAKLMTFKDLASSADTVGGAFDRATAAAIDMAASGFGTADSNAVQLGKALNDPIKGINALTRSGITFTEAEKKRIETLVKSNQMGEAQATILKAIETQVGGTAAATATASDRMNQGWANLQETIGLILLPKFNEFATYVADVVLPALGRFFDDFKAGKTPLNDVATAIGNVTNFVKDNWTWISALGVAMGAAAIAVGAVNTVFAIGAGLVKAYNIVVAAVNGVIALYKIATGQATLAQLGLNAAMLANPIGLVVAAVAALVAGLVWFFTQTDVGKKLWADFTKFMGDSIHNIGGWFSTVWQGIVTGWNNVLKWFQDLPTNIMNFLKDAGKWLVSSGKNIIDGLIQGLKNAAGAVGKWFADMGKAWIGQFKSLFGIHSPSKLFKEFGKNIMQGLVEGLTGEESSVRSTMQKASDWVNDAFDSGKIYADTRNWAQTLIQHYAVAMTAVAKEHDAVVKELLAAEDELANRIEERLKYVKDIADKYGSKLTTDEKTTAKDAIQQLRDRIARTKELLAVTNNLKNMGLSNDLYKQIVDSGNLEFAKSIQEGGAATVQELNTLAAEANATATNLGNQAGDILFNKGIDVAQGIVDGLKEKEDELAKIMAGLASEFSSALSDAIASDTRVADEAALNAAGDRVDKLQELYDSAVKKYGKNSSAATKALTALNAAKAKEAAAKSVVDSNKKVTIADPLANDKTIFSPLTPVDNNNVAATTTVVQYYAAPNASLDSETQLRNAMVRSRMMILE